MWFNLHHMVCKENREYGSFQQIICDHDLFRFLWTLVWTGTYSTAWEYSVWQANFWSCRWVEYLCDCGYLRVLGIVTMPGACFLSARWHASWLSEYQAFDCVHTAALSANEWSDLKLLISCVYVDTSKYMYMHNAYHLTPLMNFLPLALDNTKMHGGPT